MQHTCCLTEDDDPECQACAAGTFTPANLTWLTDTLAVGGDLSLDYAEATDQVADIVRQGVSVILDIRVEDDDTEVWENMPMTYVWLPTEDAHGHTIPAALFDRAVEVAQEAGDEKVFVHCHMGINRGPSVAFAIMLNRGWDPIRAFDRIREKRPIAAIYYAQDALRAHCAREGMNPQFQRALHMALQRHINKCMDASTIQHIQRTISDLHEQDRAALRKGSTRG